MSRVIKFRGWDGKKIHNDVVVYMGAGWLEHESLDPKAIHVNPDGLSCLMQFTGLKDKHGVDIYEKDVVYFDYNYLSRKEVEFKDGAFNITKYNIDRCEVIGNLCESPGLLEG